MTAGYEHGNGSGDSYQAMQLRLYQGYAAVGSEIGADVVPVGVAWEVAHLQQPGLDPSRARLPGLDPSRARLL